jgi:hypothetical protein
MKRTEKIPGELILSAGSAAAILAVGYALWKSPLAILGGFVLIAHEFGHYFAGDSVGSEVHLPFFVPLGITTIGATRIKNPDGTLTLGISILLIKGFSLQIAVAAVLGLLAYEMGWGFLGGDGRKLRAALRGVS